MVTADSPLGRGMLTGTIRSTSDFGKKDFRSMAPRFKQEALDRVSHVDAKAGFSC